MEVMAFLIPEAAFWAFFSAAFGWGVDSMGISILPKVPESRSSKSSASPRCAGVVGRVFGKLKEGKGEFQSLFRTLAVAYAESGPP